MVRAGKTSPGSPSIFLATAGLVPASSVSLGSINHRGLLALSSGEENLGELRLLPSAVGLFIFTKSLSHYLAFWLVVRTSQLIHPDVHLDTPHPAPCYELLWWLQWRDHGFLKISDESCLHCSICLRVAWGLDFREAGLEPQSFLFLALRTRTCYITSLMPNVLI